MLTTLHTIWMVNSSLTGWRTHFLSSKVPPISNRSKSPSEHPYP